MKKVSLLFFFAFLSTLIFTGCASPDAFFTKSAKTVPIITYGEWVKIIPLKKSGSAKVDMGYSNKVLEDMRLTIKNGRATLADLRTGEKKSLPLKYMFYNYMGGRKFPMSMGEGGLRWHDIIRFRSFGNAPIEGVGRVNSFQIECDFKGGEKWNGIYVRRIGKLGGQNDSYITDNVRLISPSEAMNKETATMKKSLGEAHADLSGHIKNPIVFNRLFKLAAQKAEMLGGNAVILKEYSSAGAYIVCDVYKIDE